MKNELKIYPFDLPGISDEELQDSENPKSPINRKNVNDLAHKIWESKGCPEQKPEEQKQDREKAETLLRKAYLEKNKEAIEEVCDLWRIDGNRSRIK
jgi:hypothetical protein